MPHVYGVSYFSSKGPTGDGRCKPDLVAPGERIISCAAAEAWLTRRTESTSVQLLRGQRHEHGRAARRGAIAAFLSIRREFIGQPKSVKEIFISTATDLRPRPLFPRRRAVDLMRAIQSV